jgi:hypothetical protein
MKTINTLCRQIAELLIVKAGDAYSILKGLTPVCKNVYDLLLYRIHMCVI